LALPKNVFYYLFLLLLQINVSITNKSWSFSMFFLSFHILIYVNWLQTTFYYIFIYLCINRISVSEWISDVKNEFYNFKTNLLVNKRKKIKHKQNVWILFIFCLIFSQLSMDCMFCLCLVFFKHVEFLFCFWVWTWH